MRGLAIFGGSFNPPHRTHRRIVQAALAQLPIDEVLVMPAADHPHKRDRDMAPVEARLELCRIAFAAIHGAVVDDREARRAGPSYTVTTLADLAREHPGVPLWFVIGSDNLPLLPTWREHHRLLALARFATFPRLGAPVDEAALRALDLSRDELARLLAAQLQLEPDAVSATAIRERLRRGERDLAELDPEVEARILELGLYGA